MSAALGALFDLDGTLVDTYDEHFAAWSEVCRDHGVPLSESQFRWSFGRRNESIIPELWRQAGVAIPESAEMHRIAEAKEAAFRTLLARSFRPMDGAFDLLGSLRREGWRIAAASSAPPANVDAFLAGIPRELHFDAVVSGADVTHGKPHPEVFLKAAERVDLNASTCIVFEDAPPGVEAAHNAGMPCIALASKGRQPAELAAAELVVRSLREVTPATAASLVGRRAAAR